jgi:hypothetical protein
VFYVTYNLPSLVGFFHQSVCGSFWGTFEEEGLSGDAGDFLIREEFPDTITCKDEELIICLDLVLDYLYSKDKNGASKKVLTRVWNDTNALSYIISYTARHGKPRDIFLLEPNSFRSHVFSGKVIFESLNPTTSLKDSGTLGWVTWLVVPGKLPDSSVLPNYHAS